LERDPVTSIRSRVLAHRKLAETADIVGAGDVIGGVHQGDDPVDKIVEIAERTGLHAVAMDRDVAPAQRPG
jgi:hypothetical protein